MTSFTCVPRRTRSSRSSCGVAGLLDVPAVAARLKISVVHVRLLVRHQRIPYVRHGRRVGFDARRIDAWLASSPHALAADHDDAAAHHVPEASEETA